MTRTKSELSQTFVSTLALILLLDLFVVSWLAILYVSSQIIPDVNIQAILIDIWGGKADIVSAFLTTGAVLIVYLKKKCAFNPILWAPVMMTGSVVLSCFSIGYLSAYISGVGLSATLARLGIVLALVMGVMLMLRGVNYYHKCQCRA